MSQWALRGKNNYDGACTQHSAGELSRAARAAVEVNDEGEVTATISGPVWPPMPQTAQAAEHTGRTRAVELLDGPSTLYGDCKAVVDDAHLPFKRAVHHRRVHAAASKMARGFESNRFVIADVKVKAHVEEDNVDDTDTVQVKRWKSKCNEAADAAAVEAKRQHPESADPFIGV